MALNRPKRRFPARAVGGGAYKAGRGACVWASPGPGDGPNGEVCPSSPGLRGAERGSGRHRLDLHGGLDHYWVDPCSNYGMSNYTYDGLGCDRSGSSANASDGRSAHPSHRALNTPRSAPC